MPDYSTSINNIPTVNVPEDRRHNLITKEQAIAIANDDTIEFKPHLNFGQIFKFRRIDQFTTGLDEHKHVLKLTNLTDTPAPLIIESDKSIKPENCLDENGNSRRVIIGSSLDNPTLRALYEYIPTDYLNDKKNEFYFCVKGTAEVNYSFDSSNETHVNEKNRITSYIANHTPETFEYRETDPSSNTFVVELSPPSSQPNNTWIDIDNNWMSSDMKCEIVFSNQTENSIVLVNAQDNITYTAKYCILDGGANIILRSDTEKVILTTAKITTLEERYKVNSDLTPIGKTSRKFYGNINIENTQQIPNIFVVLEKV